MNLSKFLISLIVVFANMQNLLSQSTSIVPPEPVEGWDVIQESITYPILARRAGVESAFNAIFRIDTPGNVKNLEIKPLSHDNFAKNDYLLLETVKQNLSKIKWIPAQWQGEKIVSEVK